jgi:hypothetical protein
MNVYIIEPNSNEYIGRCIIAANDFNEASRIFNQQMVYDFAAKNAIKTWNCCVVLSDKLQTIVNTPDVILDCIYLKDAIY